VDSLRRSPSIGVLRLSFSPAHPVPGYRELLREIALNPRVDERVRARARAYYETACKDVETGERISHEEWHRRHDAEGIQ
jgi:hypothetical protein